MPALAAVELADSLRDPAHADRRRRRCRPRDARLVPGSRDPRQVLRARPSALGFCNGGKFEKTIGRHGARPRGPAAPER